jgi:hypothetical protein
MPRFAVVLSVAVFLGVAGGVVCPAADLADVADQPLGEIPAFEKPSAAALTEAATALRRALHPLDQLLARSKSGADWRAYLDWSAAEMQAADGEALDVETLLRLYRRFDAEENGLDMYQFVAVRRALAAAIEVVVAATNERAAETYQKRIDKLAGLVKAAARDGTTESLDGVGPLLARLSESRQAAGVVARIRGLVDRPNLHLHVDEKLLGTAVNRVVDRVAPVNEVVLGTPVRGVGRTSGTVLLDFLPSADRAVTQLTFTATNRATTRSSKGPVTVCTEGLTDLFARRRIFIDDERVWSEPITASASTSTRTTGIGVRSRFGQKMIRRIASKKVAEIRPRAEAVSERKAREKVRQEFEQETSAAIAEASRDYQEKFRKPLQERGWYPELLRMSTTSERLAVVARKALTDQIAAFTDPPAAEADAVLGVRLHETVVNNAAAITLAGRTITQEFVEEQLKERDGTLPESLASDPDQPPWSITFAKRKPVELDADDGRVKLTIRGSRYTSGERSFPAMDIWVTYRIESDGGVTRLFRDGEVQIYPPGFEPGGEEKLSVSETSLRRILQKRFGRVFKEVVDIEPLELPGELAAAGPLPLHRLVARRDGWLAAGWREKDPTATEATTARDLPAAPQLVAR